MIFNYGFSMVGKSHLLQNKPCQDAHCIRRLDNGWYVGAVADGVGSRPNAEEGAQLAVKTAVDFVSAYMPYDYSIAGMKSMLRTAYYHAMKTIIRHAAEKDLPVENFDTTLSLAIYDGRHIVYAHSGDGAIIGLTNFGQLVEITRRQKAEDGISLIPLRQGYSSWEIDVYEENLAGVLLVTDGVLDALSPYLLKMQAPETSPQASALYMPIGSWLLDPAGIPEDEEGQALLREKIGRYIAGDQDYDIEFFYERLKTVYEARIPEEAEEIIAGLRRYNYPVSLMESSQDDKTAVGLINTEAFIESLPAESYADVDWIELQEKWNRLAYPSLYKEKEDDADDEKPSFHKWMKKWNRLEPKSGEVKNNEKEDPELVL